MKIRDTKTVLPGPRSWLVIGMGMFCACTGCETGYFRDKVDEVTQVVVVRQLGAPHTFDTLPDGRSVWTYFDRGSGTSGYGGYVRATSCRAYVLTFDRDDVLREWEQEDCTTAPATITEPFSGHK